MSTSLSSYRKRISLESTVIKAAIFLFAILQLYSYSIAHWEIVRREWSVYVFATKMAFWNRSNVLVRYGAFIALFFVMAKYALTEKRGAVYFTIMFSFCIVHTLLVILDVGMVTGLYSSNIPINYLLILGFWVGKKRKTWLAVKRIVFPLALIYMGAFLYEFVVSYINYGWLVYQNSSLMSYYSNAFWLCAIEIYIRITEKKSKKIVYILPVVLLIGAVIIRSRSWVIQSILLLVITVGTVMKLNPHKSSKFLKTFIVVSIVMIVAFIVLANYFGAFLDSLITKGSSDTRSFQYVEMLEQAPWYKWILGQGMSATYESKLYGDYRFIDNELIYLSFHYGVIFTVAYFLPYIWAIIKAWKARKKLPILMCGLWIAILWLMSVNGLSVYNRILMDIKSFIMPLFAGHIYAEANNVLKIREGII